MQFLQRCLLDYPIFRVKALGYDAPFMIRGSVMQLMLILLVVLGGMGLSVEAGLLGPLGAEVGELWATFSIFGVGAALTFILMLFFQPKK